MSAEFLTILLSSAIVSILALIALWSAARDARRLASLMDQDRLDAARYRWLRHGDNDDDCIRYLSDAMDGQSWLLRGRLLDAACDAGIKRDAEAAKHVVVVEHAPR